MNEEKLKELINATVKSDNTKLVNTIFYVVKQIIELPENTETSISQLLNENYTNKELFEINKYVGIICEKVNIHLEKNNNGQYVGLPYNIPFIKK